jgi:hypothetical protein
MVLGINNLLIIEKNKEPLILEAFYFIKSNNINEL